MYKIVMGFMEVGQKLEEVSFLEIYRTEDPEDAKRKVMMLFDVPEGMAEFDIEGMVYVPDIGPTMIHTGAKTRLPEEDQDNFLNTKFLLPDGRTVFLKADVGYWEWPEEKARVDKRLSDSIEKFKNNPDSPKENTSWGVRWRLIKE